MMMIRLLINSVRFFAIVFLCVANSTKMSNFDPEISTYDESR